MSITVTDEMVEALVDNLEGVGLEVTMQEGRAAIAAALAAGAANQAETAD